MSDVKLYKCEVTPTYDEAYDPPEFFGNVISYPEATPSEIRAAAEAAGFLVVDREEAMRMQTSDSYIGPGYPMAPGDPRIVVKEPGVYYVIPVDVEEAEYGQ